MREYEWEKKGELDDPCVFQHDFNSDAEQDQATCQIEFIAKNTAEPFAERGAKYGNQKCGQTDHDGRQHDRGVQQGKAESYGKGVDARGQAEHDERFDGQRVARRYRTAVRLFQAFFDHFASYHGEQDKGEPVVDRREYGADLPAEEVAQYRIESLKKGQEKSDLQHLEHQTAFASWLRRHVARERHATADSDSQSVKAQAYGDEDGREQVHGKGPNSVILPPCEARQRRRGSGDPERAKKKENPSCLPLLKGENF